MNERGACMKNLSKFLGELIEFWNDLVNTIE